MASSATGGERRPEAEGALVANLSLVYVSSDLSNAKNALGTGAGISVSKVTIVDVSKPATSSATIPPGLSGVAYFLPGISAFVRDQTTFFSDVSLLNNSVASTATDVRMYYTAAATGQTTVATLSPIPSTNSVTLANILSTVYEEPSSIGSLQIRSPAWQNLVVQAKLLGLSQEGSVAGEVPVFRSDRSIGAEQALYLTGLKPGSNIYLQETSGIGARVTIEYLDASGNVLQISPETSVEGWRVVELAGSAPASTATAVVRNAGSGSIAAYARVFDETSEDHWSVVDWSRVHAYELGETLRIPFATNEPSRGGRRRAVTHGAGSGAATDLSMFNPGANDVVATVEVSDANGVVRHREDVVIGPRQTKTMAAAGAQVLVTPARRAGLHAARRARAHR